MTRKLGAARCWRCGVCALIASHAREAGAVGKREELTCCSPRRARSRRARLARLKRDSSPNAGRRRCIRAKRIRGLQMAAESVFYVLFSTRFQHLIDRDVSDVARTACRGAAGGPGPRVCAFCVDVLAPGTRRRRANRCWSLPKAGRGGTRSRAPPTARGARFHAVISPRAPHTGITP